ncbi:protein arginine N-methyltransferase 3 [Cryptococcus neoformans c45]|nr:protein arginine N-methyltransferase 3 [Cryptococcus neoformans var. grubii c45]
MSYKLTSAAPLSISSSSSVSSNDSDDRCSDWASSFGDARQTKSLFDDTILPTQELALQYDQDNWDFDLKEVCEKLGLDMFGRIRLINLIRNAGLDKDQILALHADDPLLKDDNLLIPVIPDDPLLQYDFDDFWSDDDEPPQASSAGPSKDVQSPESQKVTLLEAELEKARKDLAAMQLLVTKTIGSEDDESEERQVKVDGKGKGKAVERDDDTHYFHSYEENDIHEIMLKDTVRTVSYARFLLSNPQVFRGAVVMDVGCGTGILSMLAAKAGAKHVYAIEASGLAVKARENIQKNGFTDVITVIQGKVEDIQLPVKEVDVIVSEWMGYMLLYESMLDSVLVARDRFLAPNGLMAPSQTRLVLSAITGDRVYRERVKFWNSVYGFDLSTMNAVGFDEGLTEVVDEEEVVTTESIVRDINSHNATVKSLDFHSPFILSSTSETPTTVRAFLTHFDTFFSPLSGDASHFPASYPVDIRQFGDDEYTCPVEPLTPSSGKTGVEVSFTTGPRGKYTHWKQVVFLLRNPIELAPGEEIVGQFRCKKSDTNSRELDVEIHWAKGKKGEQGERTYTVQAYKVR